MENGYYCQVCTIGTARQILIDRCDHLLIDSRGALCVVCRRHDSIKQLQLQFFNKKTMI